LEYARIVVIN